MSVFSPAATVAWAACAATNFIRSGPQVSLLRSAGPPVCVEQVGGSQELLLSGETTFPIMAALGIRGVAFLDAGQASSCIVRITSARSLSIDNLQAAYGIGFVWKSPFGPIGGRYRASHSIRARMTQHRCSISAPVLRFRPVAERRVAPPPIFARVTVKSRVGGIRPPVQSVVKGLLAYDWRSKISHGFACTGRRTGGFRAGARMGQPERFQARLRRYSTRAQ